MHFENNLAFAQLLDSNDPLKSFRQKFLIPEHRGKPCIYFTGHSLGLQPVSVQEYVMRELNEWSRLGVKGHVQAEHPWVSYHELFPPLLCDIIGCKENEVVVMNSLTVNLHLLMCTFYRPVKERYKILCEEKAFPSDQYAMESQVKWHGFNPEEAIVEVKALPGEYSLRTENILNAIYEHGNSLAMVLFGGVNYYTGQRFDIRAITKAAHEVGAFAGFDLAHAAGNVELKLHEWDVDFACWCSYKYLNSGPGGVAGIFIHERYATDAGMPRLAGWWGYDKSARFKMEKGFIPIPSAEGWQLSNAPILSMAAHRASLEIFREAGMQRLHEKRNMMSAYLLFLLKQLRQKYGDEVFTLITPEPEDEHGCQVSLLMHANGKKIFEELTASGVVADWREPDVIRIAPVPLYNTFEEIYQFRQLLEQSIQNSRTS